MRRILTTLMITAGLSVSACGPVNRGLESANQPVVSRSDYVFDVSGDGIRADPASEARRIEGWFDALKIGYGDRVSLDDPSHSGDARELVSALLARRGLLLSDAAPVTSGEIAPGATRIIVSRSSALVDCPNWDRKSQPEFASSTMSNYGCATNANLAAMVANPEDLIQGQNNTDLDSTLASKAIRGYRDAALTGANGVKQQTTGKGN